MNAVFLTPQISLVEQAYEALLGEISSGVLAPDTHLIQEVLAARYGVSRQPIQQALLLLKNDGLVQDAGRRGLVVAPLDLQMMSNRYQVRAVLDSLAAKLAAERCAASPAVAAETKRNGNAIIATGMAAVASGVIKDMIAHDVAFHGFVYTASGNPVIGPTAEVHWRFLRRVMGEVLRTSEPPPSIWKQHQGILEAIVAGDSERASALSLDHINSAGARLTAALGAARSASAPAQAHAQAEGQSPERRPAERRRRAGRDG